MKLVSETAFASKINEKHIIGMGSTSIIYQVNKKIAYKRWDYQSAWEREPNQGQKLELLAKEKIADIAIPHTKVGESEERLQGCLLPCIKQKNRLKEYLQSTHFTLKDKVMMLLQL